MMYLACQTGMSDYGYEIHSKIPTEDRTTNSSPPEPDPVLVTWAKPCCRESEDDAVTPHRKARYDLTTSRTVRRFERALLVEEDTHGQVQVCTG